MDEPSLSAAQRIIMLFVIGASICLAGLGYAIQHKKPPISPKPVSSVVFVDMGGVGHGSGVHIGRGFVLTAGHVAKEGNLKVKNDFGAIQDAEVLWYNSDYDVSLLKVTQPQLLGTANLSCRAPEIGEEIIAAGSPLRTEFTRYWGHVNGSVTKYGPWNAVFTMDMTVLPGISGGPIFDKKGDVVGIAVGVALIPMGMAASVTGIGYGVPGATICNLLART